MHHTRYVKITVSLGIIFSQITYLTNVVFAPKTQQQVGTLHEINDHVGTYSTYPGNGWMLIAGIHEGKKGLNSIKSKGLSHCSAL